MIQKLLIEGIPEHILADGIVHIWLYMAGSKKERDEKGQLFNQRFRLSGLDNHGKVLTNYVKENLEESLVWASANLTEYLPEELKSDYLDHYIRFCNTSKTLWLSELYVLHFLADLFGFDKAELDERLIQYEGLTSSKVYSEEHQKREVGLDSILSKDQVFIIIRNLRDKYGLPSPEVNLGKDIHDEKRGSEESNRLISAPESTGRQIEPIETSQNKSVDIVDGHDNQIGDRSETDKVAKVILLSAAFILFILMIAEIDINSSKPNQLVNTQTGQTESSSRNNAQSSGRSNNANTQGDTTANTQFLDNYVYNQNEVRAYSDQGREDKIIDAHSVYKVIKENPNMITFLTLDGPYYAYKRNFEVYENVPFNKKFDNKEIIAVEDVYLREDLSLASYTSWYFPKSSVVQFVQETATSVQINTTEGVFWAKKNSFAEHDESIVGRVSQDSVVDGEGVETEEEVEYIYKFVDLISDAKARRSPSIFGEVVFELKRGQRILVSGKVKGTIYYEVSISGERYYVSDTAIRF